MKNISQKYVFLGSTLDGYPAEAEFSDTDTPVNMPLVASTWPVLVRCWQHRPSTGPVLAHNGMGTRAVVRS